MRLVLTQEGQKLFNKCKRMRDFYRSKGMLLEDLTCEDLACGMDRCNNNNSNNNGAMDYDTDETVEQEDRSFDENDPNDEDDTVAASEGTEDSQDVW